MSVIAEYFFDIDALLSWFRKNKRVLPWRDRPTPYRVWVSEVMLQQTRVNVVIPYFERWMTLFPDIYSLAKADFADVIKAWEGLGYYSRVRNLHLGAQQIISDYNGEVPSTYEELSRIRGLGPYTTHAIMAFAFGKKVPCVDGNVVRVLTRYYALADDITASKTKKLIWEIALGIAGRSVTSEFAESMIELGALICQKKPACPVCPLQGSCLAYKLDKQNELPFKGKKISYTQLIRAAFILERQNKILVRRGKKGEIMEDLYEFPYIDLEKKPTPTEMIAFVASQFAKDANFQKALPVVKHSFTRYRVDLHPFHFSLGTELGHLEGEWVDREKVSFLTFSSGHKRILGFL